MVYKDGYLYFNSSLATNKTLKTSVNDTTTNTTVVTDYLYHLAAHPSQPYLYGAGLESAMAANINDRANTVWSITLDIPAYQNFDPIINTEDTIIRYIKNATANKNLLGDSSNLAVDNFNYIGSSVYATTSALDAKQATITDSSLTIARTTGLQAALDAKQATITDSSLTIARTTGLQAALDAKQATITDSSLTIARTTGLQAALDAKQATITDSSLTIARTTGLQAALDAKQATITDSSLTIAMTTDYRRH